MFVEFSNVHQEVYSCRGIPLWRVSPWPGVSSGVYGSAICSCSFGARTGGESEWVSQEIGLARATQQTILPLGARPSNGFDTLASRVCGVKKHGEDLS
jgi:hypothetical protein